MAERDRRALVRDASVESTDMGLDNYLRDNWPHLRREHIYVYRIVKNKSALSCHFCSQKASHSITCFRN